MLDKMVVSILFVELMDYLFSKITKAKLSFPQSIDI